MEASATDTRTRTRADTRITIRATEAIVELIDKMADDERRGFSNMARLLLEEALTARGVAVPS